MAQMTKKDIQKRVLKDGEPLALSKFCWDSKTRTFSSTESGLVLDFRGINNCTFKTGYNCTFNTGYNCTFKTGFNCTFKTGGGCTFDTGCDCTFDTGYNCTFKTWGGCVVVRRDVYEVIELVPEKTTVLCPCDIKGYVVDEKYSETGKKAIIADGVLSEIVSQKEKEGITIYKVINHGQTEKTYLIHDGELYSHGKTIKEARDSLKYKISDRDTSKYADLKLDSEVDQGTAIKLYRTITGACESGVRNFMSGLETPPQKLTIKEIIKLTEGQYNHNMLVSFFERGGA